LLLRSLFSGGQAPRPPAGGASPPGPPDRCGWVLLIVFLLIVFVDRSDPASRRASGQQPLLGRRSCQRVLCRLAARLGWLLKVGFGGYRRDCRASAAASRSAAQRTPGLLPILSTGPDTDTAATTWPELSLTGAETLATPGSRSATLWAQPRRLTSRSVRSPNTASLSTARWVAWSDQAARTLAPEPAVMGSLLPTGTVSLRPLGGSAARMQTRCMPSLR
jgi:hypothetical protein